MNIVIAWIMALMTQAAPPAKLAAQYQLPGHEETAEQKTLRYEEFATDLYKVAYDPSVQPLYNGPKGRALTAAVLLAIAFHESGFAHDVDKGPCYRGKNGKDGRCDSGRSACSMQVQVGAGTTTLGAHGIDGLTQADLFADRKLCFKAAMHIVRRSFRCKHQPDGGRFNLYASGNCNEGLKPSREITGTVHRFLADQSRIPGPDATFLLPLPVPPSTTVSLLDPH